MALFMRKNPVPFQIYRHFKGSSYQIIAIAEDSETSQLSVIYQALYSPYKIWNRSLDQFLSEVDHQKYPDAPQEYRFELITFPERSDKEKEETNQEANQETNQVEEDFDEIILDPLVLEFLESDSYEEKLNILAALHHRIDDEMLNTLAVAMDVELSGKDTMERFDELKNCILTFRKYEGSRNR